jgi:hypothetical protein
MSPPAKKRKQGEKAMDRERAAANRIRVMKARKASFCPDCGGPIYTGNRIAEAEPGTWVHASCAIKAASWGTIFAPTGTGG